MSVTHAEKLKIPRLGINRRGVFFVRFPSTVDGEGRRRVVQQSLRAKDPESATLRALRFCLDLATGGRQMSSPDPHDAVPYHVNVNTGEASADGPEDHERLMAFIAGNKDLFLTLAKLRAEGQQATPSAGLLQASTSPDTAPPVTGSVGGPAGFLLNFVAPGPKGGRDAFAAINRQITH